MCGVNMLPDAGAMKDPDININGRVYQINPDVDRYQIAVEELNKSE
jgi:hypothetical protein